MAPLKPQPSLDRFNRIVVKVGSSLLVDRAKGALKQEWLDALVADLAALHRRGADMLVVSSGAIALGRTAGGFPKGALKLEDSQAAAAIGQIALARAWAQAFAVHRHRRRPGAADFARHRGAPPLSQRARHPRPASPRCGPCPIINENDTVATSEIRYGDNDRLAARVATMASADLLILLSDVAGLYDAPPGDNPKAELIPIVARITQTSKRWRAAPASEFSRGGMRTKIEAARIATSAGAHMVIADGRVDHPIARIGAGAPCTWFLTPSNPMAARKIWIGGSLELKGAVHVDAGAARALGSGKSLLPAGVTRDRGRVCTRRLRGDPRRAGGRNRTRADRL